MLWLRKGVLLALASVAVIVLGWFAGLAVSKSRHSQEYRGLRESLQRRLEANVDGIAVGATFPVLLVVPVNGGEEVDARGLLPSGGVLALVSPGCADCVEDAVALQEASSEINLTSDHVLIVANNRDDSQILQEEMAQRGIDMRLYIDVHQALHAIYHIPSTPTFFFLSPDSSVSAMRAGKLNSDELVELLKGLEGAAAETVQ
jgi:hypothetical protein